MDLYLEFCSASVGMTRGQEIIRVVVVVVDVVANSLWHSHFLEGVFFSNQIRFKYLKMSVSEHWLDGSLY